MREDARTGSTCASRGSRSLRRRPHSGTTNRILRLYFGIDLKRLSYKISFHSCNPVTSRPIEISELSLFTGEILVTFSFILLTSNFRCVIEMSIFKFQKGFFSSCQFFLISCRFLSSESNSCTLLTLAVTFARCPLRVFFKLQNFSLKTPSMSRMVFGFLFREVVRRGTSSDLNKNF